MSAEPHTPGLAVGDAGSPRRSLVLAGGGIRVAWQAGVLAALEEAGLKFAHADGTSGGTLTLAMLLSGLSPAEMCERWRDLRVLDAIAPLPPRDWLRRRGFASSAGMVRRVFPQLGIDTERVRAATGIAGTFNVCDYGAKRNVAVEHQRLELPLLVAAVSLPIAMPPVEHGGRLWLDSVWIKDANVDEAVRRDAEEIWLVWCIGNTETYGGGPLRQYVHMIEISANGSLIEELEDVTVPVHVIRPELPLPLDPDFLLGRIDAATLVAMGYRDAWRYLDRMSPAGVPPGPDATRMSEPRPGVAFRTTVTGRLDGAPLKLRLGVEVEDLERFIGDPAAGAPAVGDLSHPALGERRLLRDARFRIRDGALEYEARLQDRTIKATRPFRRRDLATIASTLHARGVDSPWAGARAVARFAAEIA